jgi:hypothetical protein
MQFDYYVRYTGESFQTIAALYRRKAGGPSEMLVGKEWQRVDDNAVSQWIENGDIGFDAVSVDVASIIAGTALPVL